MMSKLLTRFTFREDGANLRYLLMTASLQGRLLATSRREKGDTVNGIHWTSSPCCMSNEGSNECNSFWGSSFWM